MVTRRKLGAVALAGIAAGTVSAQAPAPTAQRAAPEGDADLETARQAARNNAQLIAQVKLPRTTEPAFRFKA